MVIARSKLTSQGRISVPAEVRRKLGLVPGSVIEWIEADGEVVVRSAKSFTSEDIHREIFPEGPPKKVPGDRIKASIGMLIRRRRGRV